MELQKCFSWVTILAMVFISLQEKSSSFKAPDSSEKLPSARKVIDNYIMALGGYELLESRSNGHWRSNGRTSQGQTFVFEAFQGEGRYFCKFERSNGTSYSRGCWTDGSLTKEGVRAGFAWEQMAGSTLVEKQGDELQEYMRRRTFVSAAPRWLDNYKSVECTGVGTVHDQDAYQLHFVDHNGTEIDMYFSAESGLLLRRVSIEAFNNTTQKVVRDRYNYEKVGDNLISKKQTVSWNNIVYVYEVEFHNYDVKLPKGTFDIPPQIAAKIAKLKSEQSKLAESAKGVEPTEVAQTAEETEEKRK